MRTFDVIVIGGGPAGSVTAGCCARAGLSVALFEHCTFPRHKVCGDTINPGCWPVFEHLQVADSIRALPQHIITAAQFTTPDGASLDVPIHAHAIQRSQFDAVLLHHARQCGVTVFEGEAAHILTASKEVQTSTGIYRARRALVGADGRNSIVAAKLGMKRQSARMSHIAFQAHFRAPPAESAFHRVKRREQVLRGDIRSGGTFKKCDTIHIIGLARWRNRRAFVPVGHSA